MRFSVITPNYNGEAFLEKTICSVLAQRHADIELEYIIVDGQSTDNSLKIIEKYSKEIALLIVEEDTGPGNAINKGFSAATGDVISWLNADDFYYPNALHRVGQMMTRHPEAAFCFGRCPIIDCQGKEIRHWITRFKELIFPLSCRFTFQCINYISQPAVFFSRQAFQHAGLLNENLVAAWDYDFFLRLWQQGKAVQVHGGPLAAFRWYEASISGQNFQVQFREELECALEDAGQCSIQGMIHSLVRWGIVGIYSLMGKMRR